MLLKTLQKKLADGNQIWVLRGAAIMGQECRLWMPTISNAIRQMDQSTPGLDQAKSSWSRDQWISVSPTERGRRVRVHVTTCFLITSLWACFPFSFTLSSSPSLAFTLYSCDIFALLQLILEVFLPFPLSFTCPSCPLLFRPMTSPMVGTVIAQSDLNTFDSWLSQIKTTAHFHLLMMSMLRTCLPCWTCPPAPPHPLLVAFQFCHWPLQPSWTLH